MQLSNRDIAVILAIVKIFETGKPAGDPAAVAVLKDGAGISYGLSQFTHKSGNLFAVLDRYRRLGGAIPNAINDVWGVLKSGTSVDAVAANAAVKRELRRIGQEPLMRQAQIELARDKFLAPAIKAAAGSHFTTPLALAVIYDSMVHGSFARIRDRVTVSRAMHSNNESFERAWIAEYVRQRRAWLARHKREILQTTVYRMDFFLGEITRGNWNLRLPLTVHGRKLTAAMFPEDASSAPVPLEPEQQSATTNPPVQPAGKPEDQQAEPHGGPDMKPVTGPVSGQGPVASGQSDGGSDGPKPEEVVQYIPKVTRAVRWLGTLGLGGIASTTAAAFNGLPPWAIFALGMLTAVVLGGLIWLFVKYYGRVFDLVKLAVAINADPEKGSVKLVGEKTDE